MPPDPSSRERRVMLIALGGAGGAVVLLCCVGASLWWWSGPPGGGGGKGGGTPDAATAAEVEHAVVVTLTAEAGDARTSFSDWGPHLRVGPGDVAALAGRLPGVVEGDVVVRVVQTLHLGLDASRRVDVLILVRGGIVTRVRAVNPDGERWREHILGR